MSLKALVEKRNKINAEAKALLDSVEVEKRGFAEGEEQRFLDLTAEVEKLDEEIRSLEKEKEEDAVSVSENEERGNPTMEKEMEIRGLEQFIKGDVAGEEVRSMTTTSQGAIIPTHLSQEIIEKLDEVAPLFAKVPKLTPVAGSLEILQEKSLGEAGFVGEAEDLALTDVSFEKIKLEQIRCGSAIELTQHLINDGGIDIVAYTKSALYKRLGFALDRSMVKGTGVGQFQGLVNAKNVIETAVEGAVSIDDFMDVMNAMHPTLQGGAVWVVSRPLFNQMAKWKDARGHFYLTREVINDKPAYRLFGAEVIVSDVVEGVEAGNKVAFFVNIAEAYRGMIKKDASLVEVTADRYNALKGIRTLILDIYADAKIANEQALVGLQVK